MVDSTSVKIDKELLERIDKVRKHPKKRLIYNCRKQFIDLTVLKLLEEEETK